MEIGQGTMPISSLKHDSRTPEPCDTSVDELSRQFAKFARHDFSTRRSLFPTQKRHLDADDDEPCYKRQKTPDGSARRFMKKSLSFGDEPLSKKGELIMKNIVHRLATEENLIGDGSRSCCLPTIHGKHGDLKTITNDTVRDLLLGKYDDEVASYRLIDCRYPYEFEGGHVEGAINLFTKEKVETLLQETNVNALNGKRNILIFYCEFSSERGPKMYRHLRKVDRDINKENYPHLNYPEIYLMHNGYKSFYELQKMFCSPCGYTPMLHKEHSSDLRHFRAKSKSWVEGNKRRPLAQRLSF